MYKIVEVKLDGIFCENPAFIEIYGSLDVQVGSFDLSGNPIDRQSVNLFQRDSSGSNGPILIFQDKVIPIGTTFRFLMQDGDFCRFGGELESDLIVFSEELGQNNKFLKFSELTDFTTPYILYYSSGDELVGVIFLVTIAGSGQTRLDKWSGYSVDGGDSGFTSISAEWTVPAVTPSPTGMDTVSATWIGISGPADDADANIIQIGTSQLIVNNNPVYLSWFQLVPFDSENLCKKGSSNCISNIPNKYIPVDLSGLQPVKPGDLIRASIQKMPSNQNRWRLFIMNSTQGWGFTTIQPYFTRIPGKNSNADFIVERSSLFELANYGEVTFRKCRINGVNSQLQTSDSLAIVNDYSLTQLSTPSNPSFNGDAFTVSFGEYTPPSP